jgi:hypothetical protein
MAASHELAGNLQQHTGSGGAVHGGAAAHPHRPRSAYERGLPFGPPAGTASGLGHGDAGAPPSALPAARRPPSAGGRHSSTGVPLPAPSFTRRSVSPGRSPPSTRGAGPPSGGVGDVREVPSSPAVASQGFSRVSGTPWSPSTPPGTGAHAVGSPPSAASKRPTTPAQTATPARSPSKTAATAVQPTPARSPHSARSSKPAPPPTSPSASPPSASSPAGLALAPSAEAVSGAGKPGPGGRELTLSGAATCAERAAPPPDLAALAAASTSGGTVSISGGAASTAAPRLELRQRQHSAAGRAPVFDGDVTAALPPALPPPASPPLPPPPLARAPSGSGSLHAAAAASARVSLNGARSVDPLELTVRLLPSPAAAAAAVAAAAEPGALSVQSSVRTPVSCEPTTFAPGPAPGTGGSTSGGAGVSFEVTPRLSTGGSTQLPAPPPSGEDGPPRSAGRGARASLTGALAAAAAAGEPIWPHAEEHLPAIMPRASTDGTLAGGRRPSASGARASLSGAGSLPVPRFSLSGAGGGAASGGGGLASSSNVPAVVPLPPVQQQQHAQQPSGKISPAARAAPASPSLLPAAPPPAASPPQPPPSDDAPRPMARQRSMSDSGFGALLAAADARAVGLPLGEGVGVLGAMWQRLHGEALPSSERYAGPDSPAGSLPAPLAAEGEKEGGKEAAPPARRASVKGPLAAAAAGGGGLDTSLGSTPLKALAAAQGAAAGGGR